MARADEGRAQELEEAPIHGDALQAIISHVPLIDLVGASEVSRSWCRAVYSSLHSINMPKPWLLLHSQSTRSPYTTSTHAYDPRSHVWIEISKPSIKYVSSLMSSHSNFLYMLSISKLSFSFDPLNLDWHHGDAPSVWRVDPVVAKVGDSIVVAGGTCDFEDNPLAVEVFNIKTRTWRTCESIPYLLKNSAASTWLSIASTSNKLLIMEKSSSVVYSFDVETNHWSGPHDFRQDQNCFYSLIGMVADRLIMVGLIGNTDEVKKVKIWEMEMEMENYCCKEKGEMPLELIEKLRSNTFGFSTIEICSERGILYMYNSSEMQEVVVCELLKGSGSGSGCSWGSVRIPVDGGYGLITRLAFTCAEVTLPELKIAMKTQNSKFKQMLLAENP